MNPHPYITLHPKAGAATRKYLRRLVPQFLHFHFDTMQEEAGVLDPLRPEHRMIAGRDLALWIEGEPAMMTTAPWQARLLDLALAYEAGFTEEKEEIFRAAIRELGLEESQVADIATIADSPFSLLPAVDANEFMRAALELNLTATGAIMLTDYVNFLSAPDVRQRLIPERYLDRDLVRPLLGITPASRLRSP
jgi:hypothetical protein